MARKQGVREINYRPVMVWSTALLVPVYVVASATWPGLYAVDSLAQLRQALTGAYIDHHPPIMSALWSCLITLTGSPNSLFIFHIVLFGIGLLAWACFLRLADMPEGVPFLVGAACSPAILILVGVVLKDVGLAMALFVGFAIVGMLTLLQKLSFTLLLAVMLCAFYAIGVRWNSLPAVMPLLYLAAMSLPIQRRRHLVAGLTVLLCSSILFIANVALAYGVLKAKRGHITEYLQLYDLAGIAAQTGRDFFPDEFKTQKFTLGQLQKAYAVNNSDLLFITPEYLKKASSNVNVNNVEDLFGDSTTGDSVLKWSDSPTALSKLSQAWFDAILEFPEAYLRHKAAVFLSLLQAGPPYGGQIPATLKPWDSQWPGSSASVAILDFLFEWANETPLFFGWFWLVMLVLVTAGGFLIRCEPVGGIAIALGISGLSYIATYVLLGLSSSFRYLYWSIIAGTLGMVILGGRVAQKRLPSFRQHN
jgi:hypothetical protein